MKQINKGHEDKMPDNNNNRNKNNNANFNLGQ